jgi:4-aminobutyrate aminotransferase-like enzyme
MSSSSLLFPDIDEAVLQKDASRSLLKYSGHFHPSLITHASGSYIYTSTSHRMLDWTSGQMSTLLGHGHPEVVATLAAHAASLDHLFSTMLTPPVISLAKQITDLLPKSMGEAKCLFLSTGGESNEAAIRLAKFYTGRFEVVGLSASWHGITGGAIGAQYKTGRRGYGPGTSPISTL